MPLNHPAAQVANAAGRSAQTATPNGFRQASSPHGAAGRSAQTAAQQAGRIAPALIVGAAQLSLSYGRDEVLKPSSFGIAEGEFVFITGKSGSGKTTLLRSLYGEFANFRGELSVLGKDMSRLSDAQLLKMRRRLGIIFQDYKLINELSVEQNLALPLQIAGLAGSKITRQVKVILSHLKLAHKAKSYPRQLSGGEQQRIALGRAIIHNPRLIICDEPTGNLDMQSAEIIFKLLKAANMSFNASVIVATHHIPAGLPFAYRELKIENGVINA